MDQIIATGADVATLDFQLNTVAARGLKPDFVRQIDGLKDGPDLVIAIPALPKDL